MQDLDQKAGTCGIALDGRYIIRELILLMGKIYNHY